MRTPGRLLWSSAGEVYWGGLLGADGVTGAGFALAASSSSQAQSASVQFAPSAVLFSFLTQVHAAPETMRMSPHS